MENIRRGLAALLRPAFPEDVGHVSPYFDLAAPGPCLQVAGVEHMERIDFANGRDFTILIEGVFSASPDPAGQKILDRLLIEQAVDEAVEADNTGSGALFSRFQDDGTIDTGQPAAADSVTFLEYRGSARDVIGSRQVIVCNWAVRVIT